MGLGDSSGLCPMCSRITVPMPLTAKRQGGMTRGQNPLAFTPFMDFSTACFCYSFFLHGSIFRTTSFPKLPDASTSSQPR